MTFTAWARRAVLGSIALLLATTTTQAQNAKTPQDTAAIQAAIVALRADAGRSGSLADLIARLLAPPQVDTLFRHDTTVVVRTDTVTTSRTDTVTITKTDTIQAMGSAQLPRFIITLGPVPTAKRTLYVRAGQLLQPAIDSAQRGDEIVLDAGAIWIGKFILRAKPGTGWIVIRGSAFAQLPPSGTRVSPADSAAMPHILTINTGAALETAPGATGWWLVGVLVTTPMNMVSVNNGMVLLGDGSSAQNTMAKVPSNLILDRMFIAAQAAVQTKRCVALNSSLTAIVDSYIVGCGGNGMDTQAIGGWNGPGPYLIRNNRLEGGAEIILFGGADPAIAGLIPSDIAILGNYFYRPLVRRFGAPGFPKWTVKNLWELKNAQRVLFEGNIARNHWSDAQPGYAIVFGSVNQGGSNPLTGFGKACTWCVVRDVSVFNNLIDSVTSFVNVFQGYQVAPNFTKRVTFRNNVVTNNGVYGNSGGGSVGNTWLLSGAVDGITIERNTVFGKNSWLMFGESTPQPRRGFVMRDNLGGNATYNMHSTRAVGVHMLPLYLIAPYVYSGNVLIAAGPAALAALGLDATNRLPLGSTITAGADINAILAATAGVDR